MFSFLSSSINEYIGSGIAIFFFLKEKEGGSETTKKGLAISVRSVKSGKLYHERVYNFSQ